MKNNRLQCKDLPELPILRTLAAKYRAEVARNPKYPHPVISRWDLVELGAFPPATPEKLVRAKLAMLIRRGLVDGCPCGCRGDFEITPKGLAYLEDLDQLEDLVDVIDPVEFEDLVDDVEDLDQLEDLAEPRRMPATELLLICLIVEDDEFDAFMRRLEASPG
ncbi:hypothetical protein [Singulisphaera sp. PoT]|uniref:hypothetical protein n=1 Tax=Singulisphaera sp. PoT TaxID=3411797 RepID=UPI003BF56486